MSVYPKITMLIRKMMRKKEIWRCHIFRHTRILGKDIPPPPNHTLTLRITICWMKAVPHKMFDRAYVSWKDGKCINSTNILVYTSCTTTVLHTCVVGIWGTWLCFLKWGPTTWMSRKENWIA